MGGRMIVKGYNVLVGVIKNNWKLVVMMVIQHIESTEKYCTQ